METKKYATHTSVDFLTLLVVLKAFGVLFINFEARFLVVIAVKI